MEMLFITLTRIFFNIPPVVHSKTALSPYIAYRESPHIQRHIICCVIERHLIVRIRHCGYQPQFMIIIIILSQLTGRKFHCIHSSVIFYMNDTKFAVEDPAYQGSPHTKFEKIASANHEIQASKLSCFLLHCLFAHLTKIALTCKHLLQSD